jgi:hypothetical protein
MRTVEERLSGLERSSKRWRVLAGVLLAGFLVAAKVRTPASDEVVTKSLKVVDNNGDVVFVVETSTGKKNWPYLRLIADGKDAISMSAGNGMSLFEIHNQTGGPFITMSTDGDNALIHANRDQKLVGVGLGVKKDEGVITVYDKDRNRTLQRPLPANP